MASAYVDASQIEFPPRCPHCGRPAETNRRIAAHGPYDVFLGMHAGALALWIPVCRDAVRRRRWLGVSALVSQAVLVFLCGLLAVAVSMQGHNTASAVIVVIAVSLVLPIRGGLIDLLVDWRALGICAWRPGGRGTWIRLSIRNDRYFSAWASINPSASTAGAVGWRPPPPEAGETPPMDFMFSRTMPALLLAFTVSVMALHHWWASRGGRVFFVALCVAMAGAFLSLGGLVYPPVLWSIGVYGKQLPIRVKIAGAILGIAGLVTGFMLALSYPRH